MKVQDIKHMDKDDVLGFLGLESKHAVGNRLLGTLGILSVGALIGAGIALFFAPKRGRELRQDLYTKIGRQGKSRETNGRDLLDGHSGSMY